MKMYKLSALFLLLFALSSCDGNDALEAEVSRLEANLAEKEAALIEALEAGGETMSVDEQVIVHTVYLQLKDNLDEAAIEKLIGEAKKMEKIVGVQNLQIGTFQDLKDPRALSDYDLVLQMEFVDESAYRVYQEDPIHVALRESLGEYLAGPPVTHDFLTR